MTAPFVLAVPSKGRLQENAEAFFTRAGLALAKPRGARDYRGTISGLDNVEIAYLSASEIAWQLARGIDTKLTRFSTSFGRQDRAAADAEMLALALQATSAFGLTEVEIRTGDVALFIALIDALNLYPVWRRRLIKDFNRKISLEQDLERLTLATAPGRNEYEGVLAALAGSDRKAALALVTDLMSIAGTTNVGGRSVSEIADRFLEQSTLKGGALPRDALNVIKRFLSIAGDPDDAIAQLRALADDTKLNITAAIDQFESRVGFMAARGIDTGKTRFSTSFGRGLDYYTGFEFELHGKGNGVEPLVAGGRYDGLMTQLGAPNPIPAVGFSVWVETLTQLGRQRANRNSGGSAS